MTAPPKPTKEYLCQWLPIFHWWGTWEAAAITSSGKQTTTTNRLCLACGKHQMKVGMQWITQKENL